MSNDPAAKPADSAVEPQGHAEGVEILRTGAFKDHAGREIAFTEADLEQIATGFAGVEAPMILGHEKKTNTPAVGWLSKVYRAGTKLLADIARIPESIAGAINDGQWRKVSLGLNEVKGKGWSIDHLGLLGAYPPAVKGLADFPAVTFAEALPGHGVTLFVHQEQSERSATMDRTKAIEVLKAAKFAEAMYAADVPDALVIALAEQFQAKSAAEVALAEAKKTAEVKPEAKPAAKDPAVDEANALMAAHKSEIKSAWLAGRRERLSAVLAAATKAGKVSPAEVDGYRTLAEACIEGIDKTVLLAAAGTDKVSQFDALIASIERRPVMAVFGEVSPEALKTEADRKVAEVANAARAEYRAELAQDATVFGSITEDQWVERRLLAENLKK